MMQTVLELGIFIGSWRFGRTRNTSRSSMPLVLSFCSLNRRKELAQEATANFNLVGLAINGLGEPISVVVKQERRKVTFSTLAKFSPNMLRS